MVIRACLSLLAGMYALQLSSFDFSYDFVAVALVAAILLSGFRHGRWLLVASAGAALFAGAVERAAGARLHPSLAGDSVVVAVRVADFPRPGAGGTVFLATQQEDPRLPGRLRLTWFEPPVELRPGDTWRLELRLRRPYGAANPGGGDRVAWLTRERIGATGYVVNGPRNHLLAAGPGDMLTALRARFVARSAAAVDDPAHAAVLAAIVVGARHHVSAEQWDRFASTGTSHLMAISGLHVGLAGAGGYGLARFALGLARRKHNQHRAALACAVVVAALYALVSGLAVPSRRASLMLLGVAVAWLAGRRPDPARILAVAALVLALGDPLATMGAGFKLSFAAVGVLLWQVRRYAPGAGFRHRLGQLVTSQFLLLAGLAPLVVPLFGRLPVAAPLANLVAVPLFSVVTVPFALAGLVLDGPFSTAGDLCLHVAARSLALLEPLLDALAGLPSTIAGVTGPARLLLLLAAAWTVLPPGWPGRAAAWLGLGGLLLFRPAGPPAECFTARVLDVGQGLATVIRTERSVLVYDTGPAWRGGGDSAAAVLLPYLAHRGLARVDDLVVSHGDSDHAGGVASLLDGVVVHRAWYGQPLTALPAAAEPCTAGRSWRVDGVEFRFLHPPAGSTYEGNDGSCVLLVSAGRARLLLPGDIERAAEADLLARAPPGRVTAVVVPHHGSRTSSSPALVENLTPMLAVVAAGRDNRWGLPKQSVVARWETAGARVLNTADEGALGLRFCAGQGRLDVESERRARRRIWHD